MSGAILSLRRLAIAGVFFGCIALTGCSSNNVSNTPSTDSDGTASESPVDREVVERIWHSRFDEALRWANTDLQRKVLEDYVITREEYLELKNVALACIRSYGLTVELQEQMSGTFHMSVGGYSTGEEEMVEEAVRECEGGALPRIEAIYSGMITNPDIRDIDDLRAACLVSVGFVEPPFTGKDYARESVAPGFMSRVSTDPEGSKCMENPSYHLMSGED